MRALITIAAIVVAAANPPKDAPAIYGDGVQPRKKPTKKYRMIG